MLKHRRIEVAGASMHLVEGGRREGPTILFLHGWPQCAAAFERVMHGLSDDARVLAVDLPGIGGSETPPHASDKRSLAGYVHRLLEQLDARDVTLVGHDVGGMIAYAYLREYPDTVARVAILNVAIPGIAPWSEIVASPHIWHFAFHAVPELPESLVHGREETYFKFFFDALAATPNTIDEAARKIYVDAYRRPESLQTGFDWYRAFPKDAKDNAASRGQPVPLPVLYVRGEREAGDLSAYVRGLEEAGLRNVRGERISGSGHFSPDEQPARLVVTLRRFIEGTHTFDLAHEAARHRQ